MKIHTTIGLYANGTFVINGVREANLDYHIHYNKKYHIGRSLFVDGKCAHVGIFHSEKDIKAFEDKISENSQWTQTIESSQYQ